MREMEKRLRTLEEKRLIADGKPIGTLVTLYEALHDPSHPDHESTHQSLTHFYGGIDWRTAGRGRTAQ